MESAVALAGRKGFSLGSLYEVETDFKKVVSDLKLDAMSSDDKVKIRGEFAEVIGRGLDAMELSKLALHRRDEDLRRRPRSRLRVSGRSRHVCF